MRERETDKMMNQVINPRYKFQQKRILYKYYAGYSSEFVASILDNSNRKISSLLDPWNGSGTTTSVAAKYNIGKVFGRDINPVMNVIASADLLDQNEIIIKNIELEKYLNQKQIISDPLLDWFTKSAVLIIRNFEMSLRKLFTDSELKTSGEYTILGQGILKEVTDNYLCSFYYLVFFETIKDYLKGFKTSNPTWIKIAKNHKEKISFEQKTFIALFEKKLLEKKKIIEKKSSRVSNNIDISVGDSRFLDIEDHSVDCIITSPPYCTRIDYAVATRVELAVLGMGNDPFFENLRKEMIGTTKITGEDANNLLRSETARNFLNEVSVHSSKASKSYYYKQFAQYFRGIECSLSEINRVMNYEGQVVIVVQDSYYKDIYLDIVSFFVESMANLSWKLIHNESFEKKQNMASVNSKAKNYRNSFIATENVLIFEKRG